MPITVLCGVLQSQAGSFTLRGLPLFLPEACVASTRKCQASAKSISSNLHSLEYGPYQRVTQVTTMLKHDTTDDIYPNVSIRNTQCLTLARACQGICTTKRSCIRFVLVSNGVGLESAAFRFDHGSFVLILLSSPNTGFAAEKGAGGLVSDADPLLRRLTDRGRRRGGRRQEHLTPKSHRKSVSKNSWKSFQNKRSKMPRIFCPTVALPKPDPRRVLIAIAPLWCNPSAALLWDNGSFFFFGVESEYGVSHGNETPAERADRHKKKSGRKHCGEILVRQKLPVTLSALCILSGSFRRLC